MTNTELFKELNAINVNDKTEKKNDLTYLSWTYAIEQISKSCDDFTYDIEPYTYDEKLGYMVYTHITINGITKRMWLPVMDGTNHAMKDHPYNYKVYKYYKGQKVWNKETNDYETITKVVEPATMMDINKTYMRCLVKNIAMFGLGLYIYAGEDLPTTEQEQKTDERWEGLDEK